MTDTAMLWDALAAHKPHPLNALLSDAGWDARAALLIRTIDGMRFDWTKTHLDAGVIEDQAPLDAVGNVGDLQHGTAGPGWGPAGGLRTSRRFGHGTRWWCRSLRHEAREKYWTFIHHVN
ncbi:MAG: hypothetical protein HC774_01790 [Sphingomonadales bacterium]|nr:hypothetical protein [Sphingomonadales bacterium]